MLCEFCVSSGKHPFIYLHFKGRRQHNQREVRVSKYVAFVVDGTVVVSVKAWTRCIQNTTPGKILVSLIKKNGLSKGQGYSIDVFGSLLNYRPTAIQNFDTCSHQPTLNLFKLVPKSAPSESLSNLLLQPESKFSISAMEPLKPSIASPCQSFLPPTRPGESRIGEAASDPTELLLPARQTGGAAWRSAMLGPRASVSWEAELSCEAFAPELSWVEVGWNIRSLVFQSCPSDPCSFISLSNTDSEPVVCFIHEAFFDPAW